MFDAVGWAALLTAVGGGIAGWAVAQSLAFCYRAIAGAVQKAGNAAEGYAAAAKERSHNDRWTTLYAAVERLLENAEKRLDDCETDRDKLWQNVRAGDQEREQLWQTVQGLQKELVDTRHKLRDDLNTTNNKVASLEETTKHTNGGKT
jgi:hypothetical protein